MSYGLPGFRLNGKLLVSYGAAAKHCAFYPGSIVRKFKTELKDYDTTGKGTIRFSADEPLPSALVRRIVKARIAERFHAHRYCKLYSSTKATPDALVASL